MAKQHSGNWRGVGVILLNRFIFTIIFLAACTQLFAFGRKEETAAATLNNEWVLCITSFDITSLSPERVAIVSVISREIVDRLNTISYRTRISSEYAYYEELNWARSRSTAAKAIATKMDERSAEIFRGNPGWRYRQNIARIDTDLERLRANLEEIDNNAPLINVEPTFRLTRGNMDLTFPSAPAPGDELRFCTSQSADAFLSGSIMDFHGRYFMTLRLYTVYTRSFVWEESIIFSQEDMEEAIVDIIEKLIIKLGGSEPAYLAISASPPETLLLINRSFAGRGSVDLIELPPSTITVTASAPDHESITFETVLSADEITKINIDLIPIRYANVEITGEAGGRVYHGALFAGEAPLTLRLPVNQLEYIEMEADNSFRGSLVFQTPQTIDVSSSYSVNTRLPLQSGRVDRDRRAYYWAWGGTWITGIAAWLAYQSFVEANNSIAFGANSEGIYNSSFGDNVQMMSTISMGTLCAAAVVGVYGVYRFFRYLYTANRGATPLATSASEEGRN
jgi:hypothetical protein